MKKLFRKTVAILLAAVLMLPSSLAFAATPENNAQQIVNAGGKHATYNNIAEDPIEISKTLTPTNNENYLDITLQVKTKDNLKNLYDSVAVVLVLDASNTMSDDDRVASAKEAISKFIKSYYGSGFVASEKHLGIVAFNTHAQTYAALEDYSGRTNELDSKLDNLETAIKNKSYDSSHERFTNIEAGLLLANNLLKDSKMMHKFIILATDGFPTTYCYRGSHTSGEHGEIGQWTYEPSHVTDIGSKTKINGYCPYMTCNLSSCYHRASGASWGDPGYFANGFANTNNIYCRDSSCGNTNGTYADGKYHAHNRPNLKCDYGTNYSDWAAWAAESAAEYIKNQGINIYSIGIDIGGQTIHKYLESDLGNIKGVVRENEPTLYFSTMEFPSSSVDPIIGFNKDDYAKWLGENVGGSKYLDDNEYYIHYDSSKKDKEKDAQIKLMFDTISEFVTNVKNATLAKWVISDPIPEPFEFMGFKSQNGAKFESSGKNITWDLKKVEPTYKDGVYTYTMSYKIRVKTEKDGFVNEKTYNTNGTTDFGWDEWNDNSKKWEPKETEFPVPKAKGYLGSFEFTKVDSVSKEGISGAKFTLEHSGNCSVCAAANNSVNIKSLTATSGNGGKVSFSNIPSGHDYILSETKAPDGYKNYDATHKVTVAYGVTTVDGNPANAFKIENEKIQPTEISVPVKKTADEKISGTQEFEFVIEENGNVIGAPIKLKKGETGEFKLSYDEWADMGEHSYTVYELAPQGATSEGYTDEIAYSTEKYKVKIKVDVDNKQNPTKYVAVITEFSGDANGVALFHNEYLDPDEVKFSVSKTLDSTAPDETFKFVLKEGDNVIETVEITGKGTVEFKPVVYNTIAQLGTHTYTVSEIIPEGAVEGNTDEFAYDKTVYTATVNVATDGTKYIATNSEGADYNGENFTFHNDYLDPDEVKFSVSKTLDSAAPDETFKFVLKEGDNVIETVEITGKGTVDFKPIVYNTLAQLGTHTYTVSEIIPDGAVDGNTDKFAYDKTVYTATVNVATDGTKYIATNSEGANYSGENFTFHNDYLDPAKIVFYVEKKADTEAPDGDLFKFVLEENGNTIGEIKLKKGETKPFPEIVFEKLDQLGEHTYTVREITPNGGIDDKYVYDTKVYEKTVVVEIKDRAAYVVKDAAGETYDGETFVFTNEYLDPVDVNLSATKSLDGYDVTPNDFTFTIEGEGMTETVPNNGNTVTFSTLTFDKLGTYKYKVYETIGDNLSILYDRTVYDVTIEVTYNSDTTAYEADVTILKGTEEVSGIEFKNTFREPVEVVLEARKTVNNLIPGARIFDFEILDEDGNVVSTGKNDYYGNISFGKLVFDKAGTYNFKMKEVVKFSTQIIYDIKTYDVEIVVTADSSDDDPFEATVTISRKGKVLEDPPVFRNHKITRNEETEDENPSTGAFVSLGSAAAVTAFGGIVLYKIIKKRKEK